MLDSQLFNAQAQAGNKNTYLQHNLVSDIPGLADVTDTNLVDPWGISMSAASPFWISNAGKGNTTLYNGAGSITALVVTIPPGFKGPARGAPTGQVNNGSTVFLLPSGVRSSFIFATEDGTISAWQTGATATVMVDNSPSGAVYEGLTSGTSAAGPVLYAANFNTGNIDVFGGTWAPVTLAGNFKDPTLPAGFAPFNIMNLKGSLYVMYAKQNDLKKRDVAGAGNGFVSVFDLNGNFVKRLISNDVLNSPWGAAIAPVTWEAF
ncbi:MAG: TIGR03118 family protein, partial [Acidobacteriota bacterium]